MTVRVTCMGLAVPGPLHLNVELGPTTHLTLRELITQRLDPSFHGKLSDALFDEQGLREDYAILLNGRNVLGCGGLETLVEDDAELLIMPPVGGG